jgi:uncharacterized protein DUF6977
MADRPVFVPREIGSRLVDEVDVKFTWHSGMAPSQKKRNINALHENAAKLGLSPLLEISSKSEDEVGRRLSAFSLKLKLDGAQTSVECAYQGSKVFERGGPFKDLYAVGSRDAKRDQRLQASGRLIKFNFQNQDYPLSPSTAFYDWLYFLALYPHREWLRRLELYVGFTDIEFNPERSLNCQARSCAAFLALQKRRLLDNAMESFERFRDTLQSGSI